MRNLSYPRAASVGVVGVVSLALLVWVCVSLFVGDFDRGMKVSIKTERAGLLLEKNSVVKLRGVAVGHVQEVAATEDGAILKVTIKRDQADRIPTDAVATIEPATAFGPKVVTLSVAADSAAPGIRDGDVIGVDRVAGEYNGTFQALMNALVALKPDKVNAALAAVASTVDGTGAQTGALIKDLQSYLSRFNKSLPAVDANLRTAPGVLDAYTRLTPQLVGTLRNSGELAELLTSQSGDLKAFLQAATVLGNDLTGLIVRLEPVLAVSLETLRPTLELLSDYSPEVPCLLKGIAVTAERLRKVMLPPSEGGTHRNVHVQMGVGQSLPGYDNPKDLPKVAATGGPNCRDLPVVSEPPRFVRADVGTTPYPVNHDGTVLPSTPLGLLLFGEQLDLTLPGAVN